MAKKYDDEQLTITHELKQLQVELADLRKNESDISSWVTKIRQCLSIETLTREIVVELIDSISVSEVYEVGGEQRQDLNIVYRFESLDSNDVNNLNKSNCDKSSEVNDDRISKANEPNKSNKTKRQADEQLASSLPFGLALLGAL